MTITVTILKLFAKYFLKYDNCRSALKNYLSVFVDFCLYKWYNVFTITKGEKERMRNGILIGILSTLLAEDNVVTASYLAEKFEVSTRSIYRYINILSEGGVPIESHTGRYGGWKIIDNYRLKANFFTEEEYERMLFSLQTFSLQDEVTRFATQKLQGLRRCHSNATVLKSEQFIVDTGHTQTGDTVNVLSDCISSKNLCKIEYHSKDGVDTVRVVEPYCMILKDGVWYVYCYCQLRRDFRYFKVSRIVNLQVGDRFVGRPFRADSSVITTDVIKGKEMCSVVLSVESNSLSACEEWLGSSCVVKMGDGYIAKATLPYDDLLVKNVVALGSGVRVERPSKLRRAVVECCQKIQQNNVED